MFTGFAEYDELKRVRRTTRTRAPLVTTRDERTWSDTDHEVMKLRRSMERATKRRLIRKALGAAE